MALIFMLSGCVPKSAEDSVVSVSANKMNVLYIGIENPVTIACSAVSSEDLIVSIDNGDVSGENGEYIIRPQNPGTAEIRVSEGDRDLGAANFRVKYLSDPAVSLAGKTGGRIEMDLLLEQDGLEVFFPTDFDIAFEITGFMLTAEIEKYLVDKESDSNEFTEDQKELLKRLKTGDQFLIHSVTAIGPDGRVRNLPSVLFRIEPEEPITHFEEQLKLTGKEF